MPKSPEFVDTDSDDSDDEKEKEEQPQNVPESSGPVRMESDHDKPMIKRDRHCPK